MRDTFVLVLFVAFIVSGTFLAYTGKVQAEMVIAPVITGFLGLLAEKPRVTFSSEIKKEEAGK